MMQKKVFILGVVLACSLAPVYGSATDESKVSGAQKTEELDQAKTLEKLKQDLEEAKAYLEHSRKNLQEIHTLYQDAQAQYDRKNRLSKMLPGGDWPLSVYRDDYAYGQEEVKRLEKRVNSLEALVAEGEKISAELEKK